MKGRRIDFNNHENFLPKDGDYGKDPNGSWYGKPPGFKSGYANLSRHTVVEFKDGRISVTPSILVKNHLETWHGFLTEGNWIECK